MQDSKYEEQSFISLGHRSLPLLAICFRLASRVSSLRTADQTPGTAAREGGAEHDSPFTNTQ